jgi:A/G-specific adenine glycosylase
LLEYWCVFHFTFALASENVSLNTITELNDRVLTDIQQRILFWGKQNYKVFPWRSTTNQWHSLVAEILLQRTRASIVVKTYNDFTTRFPTIESLADASIEDIELLVYPLGLYKQRAVTLKQLALSLMSLGSTIPINLEDLKQLPGVGDYVAAAWLSFHGGQRAVIIDANIVRWICRMTNQPRNGETRRKKWLWNLANALTPKQEWKAYNYAVLDFCMEVCSTLPQCQICPIIQYCSYGQENHKSRWIVTSSNIVE